MKVEFAGALGKAVLQVRRRTNQNQRERAKVPEDTSA